MYLEFILYLNFAHVESGPLLHPWKMYYLVQACTVSTIDTLASFQSHAVLWSSSPRRWASRWPSLPCWSCPTTGRRLMWPKLGTLSTPLSSWSVQWCQPPETIDTPLWRSCVVWRSQCRAKWSTSRRSATRRRWTPRCRRWLSRSRPLPPPAKHRRHCLLN